MTTETLCVCCAHGQHGSHLISGAKCDCVCHPSNQRKVERKPAGSESPKQVQVMEGK